ncbi:DUF2889 domain-containing protein [Variovorax sp. Varisp85]|jgi:hypothetical protein|uniref:DUF2889 domain-containing protein n=1 Tax=Variovorax sp. Varisp85 TaxID=3243059 RepID=UPI0039A52DDF
MSLAPLPCARTPLHSRRIHCEGFRREDGLLELEATLIDTKPMPLQLVCRVVPAEEPIHQMRVRLVLNAQREIVDATAFSEHTPYSTCSGVEAGYRQVIGLCIEPGFTQQVKRLFRGIAGCTHITELLPLMASTAFQLFWADGSFAAQDARASEQRQTPLGGCHALRLDGEVVRTYFPQFHRKPSP